MKRWIGIGPLFYYKLDYEHTQGKAELLLAAELGLFKWIMDNAATDGVALGGIFFFPRWSRTAYAAVMDSIGKTNLIFSTDRQSRISPPHTHT